MSEYTFLLNDDSICVSISNVQMTDSDGAVDAYDMQVSVYDDDFEEHVLGEYHGEELIERLELRNKLEDMLFAELIKGKKDE